MKHCCFNKIFGKVNITVPKIENFKRGIGIAEKSHDFA